MDSAQIVSYIAYGSFFAFVCVVIFQALLKRNEKQSELEQRQGKERDREEGLWNKSQTEQNIAKWQEVLRRRYPAKMSVAERLVSLSQEEQEKVAGLESLRQLLKETNEVAQRKKRESLIFFNEEMLEAIRNEVERLKQESNTPNDSGENPAGG